MFMEKIEREHTINLTKVKLRMQKRDMIRPFFILAFLLLLNIILTFSVVFNRMDSVQTIDGLNFSYLIFLVGVIMSLYMTVSYTTNNHFYSVYPQNNTSRFLSSQLINYFYLLLLSIASLVIYFLQHGIYGILANMKDNLVIVYGFDIEYTLVGFLVYFMYLSLITSVITFIAVILRRFKIYGFIILTTALSFFVYNDYAKSFLIEVVKLITHENKILFFFLKGIVI
ncbi:hypothetical protein [Alkaliphilus serpentinus]|uniref:ABC transporter permease n=1 Tax=Alkaliphilus serpentinus TaxID=1482731 RepID=A0A833M9P9_9FIRM|nr:hypothetical protein [Alkaliphilus serpentinus]KAB3529074.1 hypothetical protein F8153_10505 [Alkaliphilus serpentinus]